MANSSPAPPDGALAIARADAAALVRAQHVPLKDVLGIGVDATGSFAYLVGRMLDAVAAGIEALGVTEVALAYDDWAALANQRPDGKRVDAGSLRVPFTSYSGDYDLPLEADRTLCVTIFSPGEKGKTAGMLVTFLLGEREIPIEGELTPGPHPIVAEAAAAQREAKQHDQAATAGREYLAKIMELAGGAEATRVYRYLQRSHTPVVAPEELQKFMKPPQGGPPPFLVRAVDAVPPRFMSILATLGAAVIVGGVSYGAFLAITRWFLPWVTGR